MFTINLFGVFEINFKAPKFCECLISGKRGRQRVPFVVGWTQFKLACLVHIAYVACDLQLKLNT